MEIYANTCIKSSKRCSQSKLDKFESGLHLFVIICNSGTYNCHFPLFGALTVIIKEMHAKLAAR